MKLKQTFVFCIVLFSTFYFLLSIFYSVGAFESTSTSFQIQGSAIESISGEGATTTFKVRSAGGQTATGISTSTNDVYSGILYWLVPATLTCTTQLTETTFSLLTQSAVYSSSPDATTTVDTTSATGFTIQVADQGSGSGNPGLWKSSVPTALIGSSNDAFDATTTLEAGNKGYGIQATTTASNIVINPRFLWATSTDIVGGLTASSTWLTLASSPETVSNQLLTVTHKAAVSVTTQAGDYSDIIYYSCTANP